MRVIIGYLPIVTVMMAGPVEAEVAAKSRVESPTYEVDKQETRIPMPDGVQLYGCLSMPRGHQQGERFPALLTMDPYSGKCQDAASAGRKWYREYAEAGYAVLYVHIRGTGLSQGTFPSREYSEQELQDAISLIDWLSRQPWSAGKVGMFGTSWSGFNSLQVAMRSPPALKAIVPHVATEDIYHEDVRYFNGIMHFDDYDGFADLQLITSPPPSDPFDEDTLGKRFDQPPWSLLYLEQQRDGDFWRRGIRLDQPTGHLSVPTLMIGGWYDGYRMAVVRALEHAQAPVHAVIGPWIHDLNFPGPEAALGRIAVQWWDYWLKGKANGVMDSPQLLAYMRRPYRPDARVAAIPGEWRAVEHWPPEGTRRVEWFFAADHTLHEEQGRPAQEELRYVASGGNVAGIWWGDPMPDQRPADAYSLIYETMPVRKEIDVLGVPEVHLRVSSSARQANWMVRLEDVAPDGSVTQITGGAINGTHRESDVNPKLLVPGEVYDVRIPLPFTSWIFIPGHRVRIAVSNALFPMFWPTPEQMTTHIELGGPAGSGVSLPIVPQTSSASAKAAAALAGSHNLSIAEAAAVPVNHDEHWIGPAHIEHDVPLERTTVRYSYGYEHLALGDTMFLQYETSDSDPARSAVRSRVFYERPWQGHRVRWQGETEITSDATVFHYTHHRELLSDGKVVRQKTWKKDVPRDFQ